MILRIFKQTKFLLLSLFFSFALNTQVIFSAVGGESGGASEGGGSAAPAAAAVTIPSSAQDDSGGDEDDFDDAFDPVLREADTPVLGVAAPTVNAKLQGIGMSDDQSFAVINAEVYKTGTMKNGIRVTQIRKKEADAIVNGVPMTLKMHKSAKPDDIVPESVTEEVSLIETSGEDMNFDDEPEEALQTTEVKANDPDAQSVDEPVQKVTDPS